jgi:hypothetical protein
MGSKLHDMATRGETAAKDAGAHVRDSTEAAQRQRFGGFNFGAAFFGWLVANSVSVLLIGLLSAVGSAVALNKINTAGQAAANAGTVGITGAIGLLIAMAIAYYAGGYVAGRMSRFDGARQGLGAWLIDIIAIVLLGIAGAVLGSQYNLLQKVNLPSLPVDGSSFTTGGLITMLALLIVTALAAIVGGKAGVRYHHKVDAVAHEQEENLSHDMSGQRLAHH